MKTIYLFFTAIIVFSLCVVGQTKEDVIEKVWEGAGGKKIWKDSRFLTFVFEPEKDGKTSIRRSHLWDRYTGDYRFESNTADNQKLIVLFNIKNQKGTSYLNSKALSDSANVKQIEKAYSYFINDSYWLLAPLKLEDEGVIVSLEDTEVIEGINCEVLHLTFGNLGLTPGDQYWLYVNSESGQIKRWKFLLKGKKEPGIFDWVNYKDLGGGLKLSTRKEDINQNNSINFPVASVLISVERQKFTKR